jgi:hypothetical protein
MHVHKFLMFDSSSRATAAASERELELRSTRTHMRVASLHKLKKSRNQVNSCIYVACRTRTGRKVSHRKAAGSRSHYRFFCPCSACMIPFILIAISSGELYGENTSANFPSRSMR